jgi:hypothetical protein
MFPRSRSTYFTEPAPWRDLILSGGATVCKSHRARANQFFRNAVAVLSVLSTFGGLVLYALAL